MNKIYNMNEYKKRYKKRIITKLRKNKDSYFTLKEEEKYNYDILKDIFKEFQYDTKFLINIYQEINKNITAYWKMEFSLQMLEIIKKEKQEKCLSVVEEKIRQIIEIEKTQILEEVKLILQEEYIPEFGLGFIFIESTFDSCSHMLTFFAKYFIKEIMSNWMIDDNLHLLEKNSSLKALIINHIIQKDSTLGYFCITHPELIKECIKYIDKIIKSNKKEKANEKIVEFTYKKNKGNILSKTKRKYNFL